MHRGGVARGFSRERGVEQDVVPEHAEQVVVRRKAMGVDAGDPGRVAPAQQRVPSRDRLAGAVETPCDGPGGGERIDDEPAEQGRPGRPPPQTVGIEHFQSPRAAELPAAPRELGARAGGVGGERRSAEVVHVVEGVAGVDAGGKGERAHAEAEEMPLMHRDLGPHQHQHPVPIPGERAGRVGVVVGDDDERRPRLAGRPRDLRGGARAVGQRGVDVRDAGDPHPPVVRDLALERRRPPQQGRADPERRRHHDH